MKICLINPPIEDFYITGIRRQPLGLLYIASALQLAGYDPVLLNCHSRKKTVLPLPGEFSYLKKYINRENSELKFPYKNYTHYGMAWQEIEQRIKTINADLYFISALFTTYFQEVETVISYIRKHNGKALIVTGGYHASLYPEYYLKEGGVDFVISGEGDISSVLLASALENDGDLNNIPGLVYSCDEEVKRNSVERKDDIKCFPVPARELLLERDFKAYGKKIVSIITSRGCPNRCKFCTGEIVWGYSYRKRETEDVVCEINLCIEKFGVDIINFEDDNLFPTKRRAIDLLERIILEKEKHVSYPEFTAMNGISVENIDDEVISLMKRAGFRELNVSLVTQSVDIQKNEGRPFDSVKFRSIVEVAIREEMNVRAYFILGLPGQDLEEVYDTVSFLKGIGVKFFPSVYYNVYAPKEEWKMQRSSAFFNESDEVSRDDLVKCFNRCIGYVE